MPTNYYRNAEAVILVYDVSNQRSVDSLRAWVEDARNAVPKALLVLLGNKNDLKDETDVTADRIADENDIKMHYRVSAKYEDGLDEALKIVARELHAKRRPTAGPGQTKNRANTEGEVTVTQSQPAVGKHGCCG